MRIWLLTLLLFCLGCGQFEKTMDARRAPEKSESLPGWSSDSEVAGSDGDTASQMAKANNVAKNRKIIYTATMEVVVEIFDGVEKKIDTIVKKHQGFVASANLGRMRGERRNGSWTVRIPVDQYDSFLGAVGDIGIPASLNQTASDVTEEFVDLEARIANKKKLETRIIELLENRDDALKNVLEVERELARVREEIERMDGRLRYLKDQTSLTTVTIEVREERDYVPPQSPTFSNRISNAWSSSLTNCRRSLENIAVNIVGNVIGFGFFLIGLFAAFFILRRLYRYSRKSSHSEPHESSPQN